MKIENGDYRMFTEKQLISKERVKFVSQHPKYAKRVSHVGQGNFPERSDKPNDEFYSHETKRLEFFLGPPWVFDYET